MKDIKIVVACHKPSVLPENSLFYPVQVGSAVAQTRMENIAHDDKGDNISGKNATYCELTAQYWAWKNLDADYYGLCHYRRFLCFADCDAPKNNRNQYEAGQVDEFNLARFGLEDAAQMRQVIEANDVIAGEQQMVSRLYTPRGRKRTAYEHWTAHDRALIMTRDLEKMLEILDRVSPEISSSTREYLSGGEFMGFNCFIMKRELFNELCSIEFSVLEALEKEIDLHNYCQQLKRVYGFMGEIISSGYVYHLEKQGKYTVRHVPLVYFNYTDPLNGFIPKQRMNSISVFFDQTSEMNFAFSVLWQSFLDHANAQTAYDAFAAVRGLTPSLKKTYMDMAAQYPNVTLRFLPVEQIETAMIERTGTAMPILPFLPWVIPDCKRILIFGPCILLRQSVLPLWQEELGNCLAAAPAEVLVRSMVNGIFRETKEAYLSEQMHNPLEYFSAKAMALDMDGFKRTFTQEDVYRACYNSMEQMRESEEIMNVLLEGRVKPVSQQWYTLYESNGYLKVQLPYAPNDDYMRLLAARCEPWAVGYMPNDPWFPELGELANEFWTIASRTPVYYLYVEHMSRTAASTKRPPVPEGKRKLIDTLFSYEGKARRFFLCLLPKGSKRYKAVRRTLERMGLV